MRRTEQSELEKLEKKKKKMMMRVILTVLGYVFCVVGLALSGSDSVPFEDFDVRELEMENEKKGLLASVENEAAVVSPSSPKPLMVPLTLIQGADSKAAGLSLSLSLYYILRIMHVLHICDSQKQLPVHFLCPAFKSQALELTFYFIFKL